MTDEQLQSPETQYAVSPAGDGEELTVSRSVLQGLVERVDSLETQVSHLSEENADLKHDNDRLTSTVTQLEEKVERMEEKYDALEDRVDQVESRTNVLTSQASHIADGLDEVEQSVDDTEEQLEEKHDTLSKRVAACESELDLEEWDIHGSSVGPNASPLERFEEMPRELREEKLEVATRRAVRIWENFDEWASTVRTGKLIKSGDLKRLLSAAEKDTLEYSQIYRAMDEFDKNAPEKYTYIDTEDTGKAIIKNRTA